MMNISNAVRPADTLVFPVIIQMIKDAAKIIPISRHAFLLPKANRSSCRICWLSQAKRKAVNKSRHKERINDAVFDGLYFFRSMVLHSIIPDDNKSAVLSPHSSVHGNIYSTAAIRNNTDRRLLKNDPSMTDIIPSFP